MDLKRRMTKPEGPEAIEVTHLLFRYLTHRLDERAFRSLFLAEAPAESREKAYDIALATIHDIERQEGSKVQTFSAPTLRSYIDQLAELSKGLQPVRMDPALRDRAERELQLFRSM